MPNDKSDQFDEYDDGRSAQNKNSLTHSNVKTIPKTQTAVALQTQDSKRRAPLITASGKGKIAEKILQLAFENDIRVREDSALADMLAQIDIDSPIPSEAFIAVAEILTYVYRANGEANPFDAVLKNAMDRDVET